MRKEIKGRSDIETLVQTFYKTVQEDDTIGYIFNDIVQVDWDDHLPVMYDFWETVLFGRMAYKGNPMIKHIALNLKVKLTEEHFERWIEIWEGTISTHFRGEIAENAIAKANMMKHLMVTKIVHKQ